MHTLAPSATAFAWRALLTALLLTACTTDVRARRIPNAVVLAVIASALIRAAVASWTGIPTTGLATSPVNACLGALAGLALWLPLYAAGAFGAGDVKLFAAAAAWLGPTHVPGAALYAALAGGALGLVWFGARWLAERAPALVAPTLVSPDPVAGWSRVPYGLAITAGVLGVLWGAP